MPDPAVADALAARTLQLVDVPSESRSERALAETVAASMPGEPLYRDEETLLYAARGGRPLVVLAGHLDTVPAQGNLPGRIEDGFVHGLGASDMKGGLAVMVELARALAVDTAEPAVDLAYLFFPREELTVDESPLPELLDTGLLDQAELVVVLEPTDNTLQLGCLGSLNAVLSFTGVAAHAARPWTGVNAIALAVRSLGRIVELEPRDVEVEGLVFREVLTATRIAGGVAVNVVPDRVECTLNLRYAPGRSAAEGERLLRELVGEDAELEVLGNAPPAHVPSREGMVERLRAAGGFAVEPKQAWTPVAQFAEHGLDAVNLGPGATRYAHRRDERVEIAELARTFEALRAFALGR